MGRCARASKARASQQTLPPTAVDCRDASRNSSIPVDKTGSSGKTRARKGATRHRHRACATGSVFQQDHANLAVAAEDEEGGENQAPLNVSGEVKARAVQQGATAPGAKSGSQRKRKAKEQVLAEEQETSKRCKPTRAGGIPCYGRPDTAHTGTHSMPHAAGSLQSGDSKESNATQETKAVIDAAIPERDIQSDGVTEHGKKRRLPEWAAALNLPVIDISLVFRHGIVNDGTYGCIYLATIPADNGKWQPAAIKVLKSKTANEDIAETGKKLIHEAGMSMVVNDPAIMACQGLVEHEGHVVGLVLPLCKGGTYHGFLQHYRDHNSCSSREALQAVVQQAFDIVTDTTGAVAKMHDNRTMHLDIKENNILLSPKPQGAEVPWQGRLADFGDARTLTAANTVTLQQPAGTVGYMAPEVASVQQGIPTEVGPSADIYSLGVIHHNTWAVLQSLEVMGQPLDWQTASKLYVLKNCAIACMDPNPEMRPTAEVLHRVLVNHKQRL